MRRHHIDDSEVSTLGVPGGDGDDVTLDSMASSRQAELVEQEKQRRRRREAIDKWIKTTKRRHAEQDSSFLRTNADVLFNSAMIVPPLLAALGAYAYYDHESRVAEAASQSLATRAMAEEATRGVATAPANPTLEAPARIPHYDDSAFAADYDD